MRSMGRVRGVAQDNAQCGSSPLTFPLLRNGPLPLPRGERERAACLGARDMACSAGRTAEREPMPDPTLWGLFVAASILLLLTPGPARVFLVAPSVAPGRAGGALSVAAA